MDESDSLHTALLVDDPKETVRLYNGIALKGGLSRGTKLTISFFAMVTVGLCNGVLSVVSTEPLHNYPLFMVVFVTALYIPTSFAYIIPMTIWGSAITKEQRAIPKYKFAVMGILDAVAATMQIFATTFLTDGSLCIMLQQAAIPMSMVITKVLLRTKYVIYQYVGALLVFAGLAIVLFVPSQHKEEPSPDQGDGSKGGMFGMNDTQSMWFWAGIIVLSCVPMTLSSVFKEMALGSVEIDAIFLNGWIAVFQFLIFIPMSVPCAYVLAYNSQGISVFNSIQTALDVPKDLAQGFWCYLGRNSRPDDNCAMTPIYMNAYAFFNVNYNILIILMLKYGSANVLWVASTVMVPLSNIAFAIPGVPKHKALEWRDLGGFVVIMAGVITYRFMDDIVARCTGRKRENTEDDEIEESAQAWGQAARLVTVGGMGMSLMGAEPVMCYERSFQKDNLKRTAQNIRSKYIGRLGISTPMPLSAVENLEDKTPDYYA